MKTPSAAPASAQAVVQAVVLAAITSLLAACASTGGLQPQSRPLAPETLAVQQSLAAVPLSGATWPQEDWWTTFGDSQLDRLMRSALAGQPSLRAAEARVRQAQAVAGISSAALQPQSQLNIKGAQQRFSENGIYPKTLAGHVNSLNDAQLGVSQEVDFWGRNRAAFDAAIDRVHAAEVDAQAARLMLTTSLARTYLRLDTAWAQRDLAARTLAQREEVLALVRRRVAADLDSQLELTQAEAALPAARENIAAIDETIALAANQLAALQGQGPDAGLTLQRPQLGPASAAIALPSALPAELLGRRPDIVAERWRVEALSQDIQVARARFYPNVTLTAFAGLQSVGLDDFLSLGSRTLGIGPAISLPVLDGTRLRAGLALNQAAYDAAVEQYNATLISALHDVVDQLVSLKWLANERAEQDQTLALSQRAYALARHRYSSGLASYLTVLAAEAEVLQQQRAAVASAGRERELQLNLIRALGGGLRPPPPDAPAAARLS
jgi:NodT family efflux transporter outer membrane factor (OMF) lipoprotein